MADSAWNRLWRADTPEEQQLVPGRLDGRRGPALVLRDRGCGGGREEVPLDAAGGRARGAAGRAAVLRAPCGGFAAGHLHARRGRQQRTRRRLRRRRGPVRTRGGHAPGASPREVRDADCEEC